MSACALLLRACLKLYYLVLSTFIEGYIWAEFYFNNIKVPYKKYKHLLRLGIEL